MKHVSRKVALFVLTAFAILSPVAQSQSGVGLSAAEFSHTGDETLRAAGYAFSIWGLIYAALAAFAVWQLLPRNDDSVLLNRTSGSAVIAIGATGAWIWNAAADRSWETVIMIVLGLLSAINVLRIGRGLPATPWERRFVLWPLGLLAGWLTVAAAVNLLTSLTRENLIEPQAATPAAIAGVMAIVAIAVAVLWRTRSALYPLPVAWGLVAVWVAERAEEPAAAWLALAGAAAVLALTAWLRRPSADPR